MKRLPGQCWSRLVDWALRTDTDDRQFPWRLITWICRTDAARTGQCYCGKIGKEADGPLPQTTRGD
jgi:hypothetical protein